LFSPQLFERRLRLVLRQNLPEEITMFYKTTFSRLICLAFLVSLPSALTATPWFKTEPLNFSGGVDASSVAMADFNGDGKLDIAVANLFSCDTCTARGSVGILLGNGDGTFQPPRSYDSGGNNARGIAIADLNGDGKFDVIVTNTCTAGTFCDVNSNTGSVAVLLGNGDGTFQPAHAYSAGIQLSSGLALGDFNRDGKLDVVVADGCGRCGLHNIAVLLGNGDGTFGSPRTYDLGGEPQGIAVGDIDGDGKLDVVVGLESDSGQPNGSSVVLFGEGDGTFPTSRTLNPAGKYPALADVNGDGKLDLIVVTPCSNTKCTKDGVGVLLGEGDGSFQPIQIYGSGGNDTLAVAIGDLNRDGKADVFITNEMGKVGTLVGVGDGTFSPVRFLYTATIGLSPIAMAFGDVNGDGKPDLVATIWGLNNFPSGGVTVLLNNTFWTTATALASSPNPSVLGQRVTLTATVTTTGSIAPTGRVVFRNGPVILGSSALVGGVATLSKANLPIGALPLTATYQGDRNSAKSASPVSIQVVNAPTGAP
jgi:Bacterial Ig-like domain (group 3)/FG-GAP-like repeat